MIDDAKRSMDEKSYKQTDMAKDRWHRSPIFDTSIARIIRPTNK